MVRWVSLPVLSRGGCSILGVRRSLTLADRVVKYRVLALNFPTDEVFLTTEEVLEYLQINLRTVYRLIKAGKIPAVRVGRQWRFRKRDIDVWLDTQRPRGDRQAAATPAAPVRNTRQRVLVVDDEASIRDLLSKTLALAEYDVDTAPDGTTALDRMRAFSYDLLIADLRMPGMDGLTLIRQAKRIKADLPVIIITGFSTESSAIEAVNLGVAGYLTKPFRVPQVLAAASKALGAPAA
jgi:excisionase family DNA binding protein